MQKIHKLLALTVLIMVLYCGTTFAQLSPYQGIINPYERYGGLGGSYGGVIIAEPDAVPAPLDNPAGIAFQRAPQVFAGMNLQFNKYENDYYRAKLSESTNWESEINPGQLAGSYPLNLLHREAALAFSLAKIPAPEFEAGYVTKIDSYPDMNHDRTGNVGTAIIGVSMKVTPTLSFGLSYTRWLGSWSWEDKEIIRPNAIEVNRYGKGKFIYDGNCFSLGMIKQMNRFSIGVLLQSPFTLMHAEDTIIYNWILYQTIHVKQQYNGAAAIGLCWRLIDSAKLGLGYRFQNDMKLSYKSTFKDWEPRKQLFHKLSIAAEYTLHYHNASIPLYLAYQHIWQEGYANVYRYNGEYMRLTVRDDQRINGSLQMGVNCYYKSFAVHLAARWQQYTLNVFNDPNSPPSSMVALTSRYDTKKTCIMIDMGVSYFIR